MKVTIGRSTAKGKITAPPSKSIQHRYIICALLSDGISRIRNFELSKDIEATIKCAEALGTKVTFDNDTIVVEGARLDDIKGPVRFYCNESGSTMRFFMGIAMGIGCDSYFYGSQTLLNRPMGIYEDICASQGILFERKEDHIRIYGRLTPGEYKIPGNISSQFITGLMFSLPLLKSESSIGIIPPVESASYIDLTVDALTLFGIDVKKEEGYRYIIPGDQSYKSVSLTTEGDESNAAFLEAFNLFGGEVEVEGLNENTLQGDRVYKDLFRKLDSEGAEMDISDCPDLGPVLMGVAALKYGAVFTGTKRLKIKESDRGSVMAEELRKLGVKTKIEEDRITVDRSDVKAPECPIESHNDHRIAMTFSVLLSVTGGVINGAESVRKSYPSFYEDIKKLGIDVTIDEHIGPEE
ncbi:MAG: 3-phosphoshikimate 1-carboxyvinyltransferase [Lachnospiraceae bacterium]|nr:3-phosphoshikimate 1-carboxyvinyltransferase [Lachnospiraceae bacterium]